MKKHAHIKHNETAETHSDENSGGASFDNTTTASAGVEVGDENASIGIEASAKTGTEASVDGGLDGNNVYVEANYSDTTEVHVTIEGQANAEGFGVNGTVDAYAKTGNEASLEVRAGDEGV